MESRREESEGSASRDVDDDGNGKNDNTSVTPPRSQSHPFVLEEWNRVRGHVATAHTAVGFGGRSVRLSHFSERGNTMFQNFVLFVQKRRKVKRRGEW